MCCWDPCTGWGTFSTLPVILLNYRKFKEVILWKNNSQSFWRWCAAYLWWLVLPVRQTRKQTNPHRHSNPQNHPLTVQRKKRTNPTSRHSLSWHSPSRICVTGAVNYRLGILKPTASTARCLKCGDLRKDGGGKYVYCRDHNCNESLCEYPAFEDSQYCSEHKCSKPNCDNRRWSGSEYCAHHKWLHTAGSTTLCRVLIGGLSQINPRFYRGK